MSTRDLRVRFVGDAGDLKSTFQEVGASAQASSVGIRAADGSVNTVGRSFVKTGRVFKATGKIFKSSGLDAASAGASFASAIPALSGVSGAAGQLIVGLDSLSGLVGSLGAVALPALAVAAVATAAAYVFLHNDVNSATDAMRAQQKANEDVAASHRATTDAVYAHKDALAALRGANLSHEEAVLGVLRANDRLKEMNKEGGKDSLAYRDALVSLEQANQKVTKAETDHGRSSVEYRKALIDREQATKKVAEAETAGGKKTLEYREALLAQKRAQESLKASREDLLRKGAETIAQTQKSNKAIDDEVESTHKAADAARGRALGLKLGIISGNNSAAAAKANKAAIDAEAKATAQAAAKHRDNAQRAREMAAALGTATPRAKALHDRLIELARTEVTMAQAIAAMHQLASAAGSAAGGVQHVYDLLRNPPSAPRLGLFGTPGGGGGGGKGKGGSGGGSGRVQRQGQKSDALEAGRGFAAPRGTRRTGSGSPLTASDRSGASIAARHRDDTSQDKIVGARAIAGAKGVTNEDKLADIGDRAILAQRKREITLDAADVKRAIGKVNARIVSKRKTLQSQRVSRRNVKGKKPEDVAKKQAEWTTRIRATLDEIRALFDERRALNTEAAELKAEAASIGYDIGVLDAAIASMPDVVPPEAGTPEAPATERDFLEADAAKAALTPDTADDKAAAGALLGLAQREYDAAIASGDPRKIGAAAQALKQAQDAAAALDENTAAINANTDQLKQAFGGSTVISYRGQSDALRWLSPPSSDRLVGAEVGM